MALAIREMRSSREFPRPEVDPVGGPTIEQINLILETAPPIRVLPFATLAFGGMRAGDLRQLRPRDIDLKGKWIYICSRPDAKTKTRRSWKVPVHDRLYLLLEQVPMSERPWFFTALPSKKYPDGLHHLNMKHVNEDFEKVLRKLGLPTGKKDRGYTLHSLRSSFKTICINAGIPKEVVDIWQGHSLDKRLASNRYYKLSDEKSQEFMSKVPFGNG